MKSRNGWLIATSALSCASVLSINGCSPSRQARSKVGDITNSVMNSASEVSTMLGGELCSPNPERKKESAMMKRVKLVTMMRRPGATESAVRTAAICSIRPVAEAPPVGSRAPRSTVCAAAADPRATMRVSASARRFIAAPGFLAKGR